MKKIGIFSLVTAFALLSLVVLPLHSVIKPPKVQPNGVKIQMDTQQQYPGAVVYDPSTGGMLINTTGDNSSWQPFTQDLGAPSPAPAPVQTDPYAKYGGQTTYNNNVSGYDQAIANTQSAYDRTGAQLNSGNQTIDTSYTNALNQLLQGRNTGERNYNTTKQTSATNYVGAKNTIGSQAGDTLNGLLRLLGSRGAGGSSAYLQAAPQAVARGASLQRSDVGNTFGQNNQALDTNWGDFLQGYNNQVTGAGAQRDQQKQALLQANQQNQASLLQSIAQLRGQKASYTGGNAQSASQPYIDQANGILNGLANYSTSPINYQTQAYTPPSLASYTTNPQATPTYQAQTSADYFSPYLQSLLGKKQPGVA